MSELLKEAARATALARELRDKIGPLPAKCARCGYPESDTAHVPLGDPLVGWLGSHVFKGEEPK